MTKEERRKYNSLYYRKNKGRLLLKQKGKRKERSVYERQRRTTLKLVNPTKYRKELLKQRKTKALWREKNRDKYRAYGRESQLKLRYGSHYDTIKIVHELSKELRGIKYEKRAKRKESQE